MSTQEILYQVTNRIATITLNRPERLNAWTPELERELKTNFQEAEHDDDVRVIVLTGAGRGFCAGADLSILSNLSVQASTGSKENSSQMSDLLELRSDYTYFTASSKPVIAAVNGPAVGLGLVMILSCDIRLASAVARFGTAFSKRGLIAEHGAAWLLPRIIGLPNAMDLLLSARQIDADEALRIGLVHRVLAAENFKVGVQEYARDFASNVSPRSMRVIKRQMYEAMLQTLPEALATADREMVASFESEDFQTGITRFLSKNRPAFTGR
jgi:enoyl-CoA hydratase/carnithine racemase